MQMQTFYTNKRRAVVQLNWGSVANLILMAFLKLLIYMVL